MGRMQFPTKQPMPGNVRAVEQIRRRLEPRVVAVREIELVGADPLAGADLEHGGGLRGVDPRVQTRIDVVVAR